MTNPIDVNVNRSKHVSIKINDLYDYEAHVAKRIAEATATLEATKAEDAQAKTELREIIAGLKAKLANSKIAFQEHQARGTEIENLLDDFAVINAIGNNRINAALNDFANLKYDEIDAVFIEAEEQTLMNLAKLAYGRGLIAEDAVRWQDAYTHYKRAVSLHETTDHLQSYARMTWRLAKGDEAVTANEKLVALTKTDFGDQSAEYAIQLNNLASVVQAQDRYSEAEGLYREALAIDAATIGTSHPDYAIHLNNLALVVKAQGRYSEAEGLYREALAIDAATIGTSHPSYATHLNNLAVTLAHLENFTEACDLLEQALTIRKATLPADHPDIASTERSLAIVIAKINTP